MAEWTLTGTAFACWFLHNNLTLIGWVVILSYLEVSHLKRDKKQYREQDILTKQPKTHKTPPLPTCHCVSPGHVAEIGWTTETGLVISRDGTMNSGLETSTFMSCSREVGLHLIKIVITYEGQLGELVK